MKASASDLNRPPGGGGGGEWGSGVSLEIYK